MRPCLHSAPLVTRYCQVEGGDVVGPRHTPQRPSKDHPAGHAPWKEEEKKVEARSQRKSWTENVRDCMAPSMSTLLQEAEDRRR